jgi:hypothetical protein
LRQFRTAEFGAVSVAAGVVASARVELAGIFLRTSMQMTVRAAKSGKVSFIFKPSNLCSCSRDESPFFSSSL